MNPPDTSANLLNSDLNSIHIWSKAWRITFNPTKPESVLFSKKVDHPPLLMDNTTIPSVNNHKHLGLTLSEDVKWKDHIKLTLKKAWQRIAILRTLNFVFNRSSLEKMYFCFIRRTLEYADVVWNKCTNELQQDTEAVQIEAARLYNTQHMLS